jgi:dihydrofolate reductase
MGKVVAFGTVSLDGYIEGPGQDIGWHRVDEDLHREFNDQLSDMVAFVSGRITHQLMAGYWPTADAQPDVTPVEAEFAAIWRDTPKYVYSRTLDHADWNTTIKREVVADEVEAIKANGDVSLGGARLGATFLELGLIDEYRLYVNPIALGAGTSLFPPGVRVDLDLVESSERGNGVVFLRYQRPRLAPRG